MGAGHELLMKAFCSAGQAGDYGERDSYARPPLYNADIHSGVGALVSPAGTMVRRNAGNPAIFRVIPGTLASKLIIESLIAS